MFLVLSEYVVAPLKKLDPPKFYNLANFGHPVHKS